MFETVLALILIAAVIALLVWQRRRLPAWARQARRLLGAGREALRGVDHSALLEQRLLEAAIGAAQQEQQRSGRQPTLIELGSAPTLDERPWSRAWALQDRLNAQLRARDELAEPVRVVLRELDRLPRGGVAVISVGHDATTMRVDEHEAAAVTHAGSASAPHRRAGTGSASADEVRTTERTAPLIAVSPRPEDRTRPLPGAALLAEDGHHPLLPGPNAVGRARASAVLLSSAHASAQHATISFDGTSWALQDHSRNGSWVDGRRLERDMTTALADGARIRFADQEFLFAADRP